MARPSLRRLLLVGMRGAGKTAAGRQACATLQIPFIDLDERALLRCGALSVRDVFAAPGGEAAWRAAECAALREAVATAGPCVVALGAGAPEHPPTADAIRHARFDGWLVAHVRVTPRTSAIRLSTDGGDRPALTSLTAAGELAALHARRTPVYESLSDIELDGEQTLQALASSIGRAVRAP